MGIAKRLGLCLYHAVLISVVGWLVLRDQITHEKIRLLKDAHNQTVEWIRQASELHASMARWITLTQNRLDGK